jgi:ATP-dependent Zn protease
MVLLVVNMFQGQQPRDEEIGYSQFIAELNAGHVQEVTVQGNVIRGTLEGDQTFKTYGPQEDAIHRFLDKDIPSTSSPRPTILGTSCFSCSGSRCCCSSACGSSSCARCRWAAARRWPSARAARSC